MSSTAVAPGPRTGSLYDVVDVILDKGLVIDAFVRVSLVGIELLTIDARIVVASVDTYLHFAEAANRLDLQPRDGQPKTLPDLFSDTTEEVANAKTKGAIEGGIDKIRDTFGSRHEEEAGG
jgi:hypothetical protein